MPLILATQPGHAHRSDYTWLYPFDKPTPGGVLHVSNAIIDLDGRIGVWSDPAIVPVESGWRLWGGAWNQPVVEDAAGIAWKVKIVELNPEDDFPYNPYTPDSEHYFYTGWGGSYPQNEIAPYSSHSPRLDMLTQDAYRTYQLSESPQGGRNVWVAPVPVVMASSLPLKPMEFAWCRVAETGETELSPSVLVPIPSYPEGTTPAKSCYLEFRLPEFHPQGTVGYHLYCREVSDAAEYAWQRVPQPECYGVASAPDDWLFNWRLRQFEVTRLQAGAPSHAPVATPQSNLTSLHLRLRNETGDVIVEPGEVFNVTCPVIDEWGKDGGGTTSLPHKFGRKVRASDWGKWQIVQQPSMGGHTSWPVVGIFNQYSRWYGAKIQANGGDALATSDYSGGQCFGNQFHECEFRAQSYPNKVTCGVRIDGRSTVNWGGYGDHTASELLFRDCEFSGSIPLWIAGNQTANVRFERLHGAAYGHDSRSSFAYIENPNTIRFSNGCYADAFLFSQPQTNSRGVIFRFSTYHASLQIDDIWIDMSFVRFIEANGISVQLKLIGGKLNVRGNKPLLGLFVNQHSKSTWLIEGVQTQNDPGTVGPYVVNFSYREVELLLERTGLLSTILREPTEAEANAMFARLWGAGATIQPREPVGYRVPFGPSYSVFNSLTNGKEIYKESISRYKDE
jgi:hypothetical protein